MLVFQAFYALLIHLAHPPLVGLRKPWLNRMARSMANGVKHEKWQINGGKICNADAMFRFLFPRASDQGNQIKNGSTLTESWRCTSQIDMFSQSVLAVGLICWQNLGIFLNRHCTYLNISIWGTIERHLYHQIKVTFQYHNNPPVFFQNCMTGYRGKQT